MEIKANDVKELREKSGAGMMDCKKALTEANGDFNLAIEILRKKGIDNAAKKSSRTASQGVVAPFISENGKVAVIAEINCETDFVAKTDDFRGFANYVSKHVADKKPSDVTTLLTQASSKEAGKTVQDEMTALIAKTGENGKIARFARYESGEKAKASCFSYYIHGEGKIGVLVDIGCENEATTKNAELATIAKDIAMHVAAARPLYLDASEVPAEIVAKEKEIYKDQMKDSGKPAAVIEKIVEGKIGKFYSEVCLVDQIFVKDPNKKVKDLVADFGKKANDKVVIARFARFQLGENN